MASTNHFNIPPDIWNTMNDIEKWAANKSFLDETMQKGNKIVLSDQVEDISNVSGTFRKELDYLIENGYRISDDGTEMVKIN